MGISLSAERVAGEAIERRLTRARVQLALDAPFLASAVLRLPLRSAGSISWCATMATDGYHIFYNPAWSAGLAEAELRGVLAHEVMHAVLDHQGRRGAREARRWNVACDLAINLMLVECGFTLPAGGHMDWRYRDQTAEQIHEALPETPGEIEKMLKGEGLPWEDDVEADGDHEDVGCLAGLGPDLIDPEDRAVMPLRDADAPDKAQLRELRAHLRTETARQMRGWAAGRFQQECAMASEAQIDWRAVLRNWLHDRIRTDWSSWPYAKKHLHRGLYLPSIGIESPGTIVFAIDTSGSMSVDLLARIVAELRSFRETFPCELIVIQADESVQSVTRFEAVDGTEVPTVMTMQGRGGTDFRPVFAWVGEQRWTGSVVMIYATDGFGAFPEAGPPFPVIWLMMPEGAGSVPFGVRVGLR